MTSSGAAALLLLACTHNPPPSENRAQVNMAPKPADAGVCEKLHCPETLYNRKLEGAPRRGIEVDGSDIFWCEVSERDGNVVRAAPKTGAGPIRTLGGWFDFGNSRSLLVDELHVYWLRPDGTGVLVRVEKDGTNLTTIALPAASNGAKLALGPLAQTEDTIILATPSCSEVVSIPKDGSTIQHWNVSKSAGAGGLTGLESFAGVIYCANGASIHALDPATGGVIELVGGQDYAGPLAMVGDKLYFANNDDDVTQANETLVRYDVTSRSVQTIGPALGPIVRLLYDENRRGLYWLTGLSLGAGNLVKYSPDSDAAPELVFAGQDVQGNSTMDADYIYWLSDRVVTRWRKG